MSFFQIKLLLLSITLVNLSSPCLAQQGLPSKIDKKDLRLFVRTLASDSLEGRETGTRGQRKAAKFISDRFRAIGVMPYQGDNYLETFKPIRTYWGSVYVKASNVALTNFDQVVFQGSTPQNTEVEKELIFGGYGTAEDLNQIDVKDKLVLVFLKNLRATYEITTSLGKRKASGVILANPDSDIQFESIKNTFKDHSLQKRLFLNRIDSSGNKFFKMDSIKIVNSFIIPNTQIKNVMGISTNKLLNFVSNNEIKKVPVVKVKIKAEKIVEEVETSNVIGFIKGKTDKTIVISAHYDHMGKSEGEYFPGADDNASGTSALLEIAEEFFDSKDLNYNLMFLATSGEEQGLLGSLFHVSQPGFNPKNIVCNLNLDMIARNDGHQTNSAYLYCIGTDQFSEIHRILKKADSLYAKSSFDFSMNSKKPSGIYTRSDQYNFYKKGIPAIHFFSGFHKDYHKPTDTTDRIDFQNLEDRVGLISLVIKLLETEGSKISPSN